jgi:hypothetical protein
MPGCKKDNQHVEVGSRFSEDRRIIHDLGGQVLQVDIRAVFWTCRVLKPSEAQRGRASTTS